MPRVLLFVILFIGIISCQPEPQDTEEEQPEVAVKTIVKIDDPLAPRDNADEALTGRLAIATLATTELDAIRTFYVEGMGMSLMGPLPTSPQRTAEQKKLWGIADNIDYDLYLLHRANVPGLLKIRLMHLKQETPHIHESWSSRELGPFSIGFPNGNQTRLDARLRALGVESMAPISQEGTIPLPNGTSYGYLETIYKAPGFLHAVGIQRKDGMSQLAPIDSFSLLGGPAYAAQVLDDSDLFLAFLTDVLGLELRSDRHRKTSPGSALGLEEGIPFRSSLVFSKGESHGYLLLIDYEDDQFIPLKVAPRLPNQGMGMWSFQVKDIHKIRERADKMGVELVSPPVIFNSHIIGNVKAMTMLAPNGFLIEVYEELTY